MDSDIAFESNQDSNLLLAAVAMTSEGEKDAARNPKSLTHLSPKLRSKVGSGSTNRNCTKKPTTLPNETVEYLKAWMMSPEHIAHPYPTESEKAKIMDDTGVELKQLTNWFVNNRKRYWKPRVEAHLLKDQEVISESAFTSVKVDSGDSCDISTNLEKCVFETVLVESVRGTPSSLRTSRRKGLKGTTKLIEIVSPNSTICTSNAHLISGHNSLASQSDGTTSCSDSDDERLLFKVSSPPRSFETTVYEKIDVHILRPALSSSILPLLTDVTVLPNVAPERILKTYEECPLIVSSMAKKNLKSQDVVLRRDAEILRLKKHCLSTFLDEHEYFFNNSTEDEMDDSLLSPPSTPKNNVTKKRKHEIHVIPSVYNENHHTRTMPPIYLSPRPKYRRRSIDVWKEACQTANHVYDDDELPSLEEATRLFGYAN